MSNTFIGACLVHTVQLLEAGAAQSMDPHFTLLTAQLLDEVARIYPHIVRKARKTKGFRNELEKTVVHIRHCGTLAPEMIQDAALPLFEAALILCCEAAQAEGTQQRSSVQESAEQYFQHSGQWARGDGTLISRYYYEYLGNKAA